MDVGPPVQPVDGAQHRHLKGTALKERHSAVSGGRVPGQRQRTGASQEETLALAPHERLGTPS